MKIVRPYPRRHVYKEGDKFFSFLIVAAAPAIRTKCGRTYTAWNCRCDCGTIFTTTTKQIRKGIRKSCGCLSQRNRFKSLTTSEVIVTAKLNHYRNSAKRRSLTWSLTRNAFEHLLFGKCVYCGQSPNQLIKTVNHSALVNGIDRVDNTLGYVEENCVSCCKFCNYAKGASSLKEFKEWLERIRCLN